MSNLAFFMSSPPFPRPFDAEKAATGLERWRDDALRRTGDDPALATFMQDCTVDGTPARALLDCCFGNSPFLTACLLRDPAFLRQLLETGPDATRTALFDEVQASLSAERKIDVLMRGLRVGKRRVALLTALADIAGLWPLETITETLSDYAETALSLASGHLLREGHLGGHLRLPDPDRPENNSGFVVLGMGKLGARELNYSSDIDIIVLYDHDRIDYTGTKSPQEFFVRLTKSLVRIMDERTGDGYVFRTDLRLRPDPGSTAVAISTDAAETYYESFGQNWERAAMIKVRTVAGDRERGAAFIRHLRPFVWRRSLDFYAIQDIHSIKRQINAHRGGATVAVAGHNIKVGRGGIREIEFFAQTQQLIWGGRVPEVRPARTLDAINALVTLGQVDDTVRSDLDRCYRFLRGLEHRLQMIDDAQTQTLPEDDTRLSHVATFYGFTDLPSFDAAVRGVLETVERHYAALFEEAPSLAPDNGNLVFTGHEDDPGTLATLSSMGFTNPQSIAATIRGWHHGRYRATRSTRSKELLTELIPTLLTALGRTAQPDSAFFRFDEFLAGLPAGVQIFSLFHANPPLLDLVAEIMGDAPRLASILAKRPNLLDSVLALDFFDAIPGADVLGAELDRQLEHCHSYEEVLDVSRLWSNGRRFQVGVQTLRRLIDAREAGYALTNIADAVLSRLLTATEAEFVRLHGTVPGGGLAVVALGKMGGREMTATSDLDLITVYDTAEGADTSDGPKPLSRNDYFIRLTQRFVNAITALTAEGRLYEVDMRLRPSGSKGPLAVSLPAFIKYNAEDAWTWEKLAQTRARAVCGPPDLCRKVETALRSSLTAAQDPDKVLADVADMRALMARERKAANLFDVKLYRGGLVDVEFIVQYLLLRHAATLPQILTPTVGEALPRLREAGLLTADQAATLLEAQGLWLAIQGLLRYSIDGTFNEAEAPAGLTQRLAAAAAEPDFERLKARMTDLYDRVHAIFRTVIDEPAEQARTRRAAAAPDSPVAKECPQ